MTTIISFELAKLLKEKGFDYHLLYNNFADYYDYFDSSIQGRLHVSDFPEDKFPDVNKWTPVPYIHQVVMWLYEKHKIWIWVEKNTNNLFTAWVKTNIPHTMSDTNSPTEAYSKAIEYTLNNLI